jgi:hypothetical protein
MGNVEGSLGAGTDVVVDPETGIMTLNGQEISAAEFGEMLAAKEMEAMVAEQNSTGTPFIYEENDGVYTVNGVVVTDEQLEALKAAEAGEADQAVKYQCKFCGSQSTTDHMFKNGRHHDTGCPRYAENEDDADKVPSPCVTQSLKPPPLGIDLTESKDEYRDSDRDSDLTATESAGDDGDSDRDSDLTATESAGDDADGSDGGSSSDEDSEAEKQKDVALEQALEHARAADSKKSAEDASPVQIESKGAAEETHHDAAHPEEPTEEAEAPLLEEWMIKKGAGMFAAKKNRLFRLDRSRKVIEYFVLQDDKTPKGSIELSRGTSVKAQPCAPGPFNFVINTANRQWVLTPRTMAISVVWQCAIQDVIRGGL